MSEALKRQVDWKSGKIPDNLKKLYKQASEVSSLSFCSNSTYVHVHKHVCMHLVHSFSLTHPPPFPSTPTHPPLDPLSSEMEIVTKSMVPIEYKLLTDLLYLTPTTPAPAITPTHTHPLCNKGRDYVGVALSNSHRVLLISCFESVVSACFHLSMSLCACPVYTFSL